MKVILATALVAAASLAGAAVPITASAAPALACAAAAVPPPAEPLAKFTSSALLASDSGESTATTERLRGGLLGETSSRTADQQGRRDTQVPVVARSCI